MARDTALANDRANNPPPPPESLIPNQRARRQRIVVSALSLLEQQPYEKIQMRDVAAEANVALGTVYRYFVSKEHLFAAVLVEWSDKLSRMVQSKFVTAFPLRSSMPSARRSAAG